MGSKRIGKKIVNKEERSHICAAAFLCWGILPKRAERAGIDITEEMSYNSSVAKLNPFRYRGYYYDTETGLYYLNSRYYDPSIGRFINADDISYIQPTDINGLNLFAYCYNNPVMYYDFGGAFPILIALILGAFTVAGMVTGGVTAHNQGKTGWAVVGDIFLGGAMGFAAGGLVIATIGAGAAIFGSAGLSTYILGVTAARAFALGALAYNAIAMFVAPIIGISMQPIEWGNPSYKPEKPGETPKHPAYRKTKSNFTKVGMIDLSCIYMIY